MLQLMNENEMLEFGKQLGQHLFNGAIITLNGELGVGKTTLTKGIGAALGIKKVINSPTFTIVKIYHGDQTLYHFDAYRLEGQNEELGFEEMFEDDGICVIEWPQYIEDILPDDRLEIHMTKNEDQSRSFSFVAKGEQYQNLLEEMNLC
ncbi:MAG: tRNA (adenosine(37)-N6)-threonylcarbamoyltransferase complex ATPase subunit type 1 TsaE [Erysipelotrichaceae bacterium]|nr:tRNA (adenosine(37)-N6)-threonylcarbamoyltransferase complex ATPase subunit type 1 TsaE [Erysipelotrichaceae bacterium]